MNRRQKLVQQQFLNKEETVIKRLDFIYRKSLADVDKKIKDLNFKIGNLEETYKWLEDGDPQKDIIQSQIQSKIYQKQYQQSLHDQLDGILNKMRTQQYLTVADYLDGCYEDGFVGSLFDLHGQGIPLMMPLDQTKLVRAVQLDSKISKGLYTKLGEDVDVLKKKITTEVSRSIATGSSYAQTAKRLADQTRIGYNKAIRIARTEGHRIQTTAAMDVMEAAKEKGADVLKQWDAALDARTRESHAQVDGEIREVDEKFSNGLMFPGDPSGGAAEVVNCRCALLQRARWALDDEELQTLKDRAAYFGLDKSDQFDDFKKKYLKAVEKIKVQESVAKFVPAKTLEEAEEYAKRFVTNKTWSGDGNVSFKGLSVDSANTINETLGDLYAKYDLPKLRNIQPMNFREKIWKGHEKVPMAYRNISNGDLFFNPKIVKDKKNIVTYETEGRKAFDFCSKNLDKFTGENRKMVETYIKAGRQLVEDDVENPMAAMVQHEMGHHIQNQLLYWDKPGWQIVKDGFEKYAVGISGYATKTKGEYIAESFCAFVNGEADRIDPALKKYFEGLAK